MLIRRTMSWRFSSWRLAVACALMGMLALAACAPSAAGNPSTPSTPAATATAKPKPKPTGVPTITEAFCQQILTIAEANQIMQPPTTATTIRIDKGPAGGSCQYEYKLYNAVVTLTFLAYTRGSANAASDLAAQAAEISSNPDAKTTVTPVSGVGDAAVFVTAAIASPPLRIAAFDVIDGALFLSCANFNVGSASFADQQTKLTQICQQVLSRL